jgi:hypothetical protein
VNCLGNLYDSNTTCHQTQPKDCGLVAVYRIFAVFLRGMDSDLDGLFEYKKISRRLEHTLAFRFLEIMIRYRHSVAACNSLARQHLGGFMVDH